MTVPDLKDTFFMIPLPPDCQDLFTSICKSQIPPVPLGPASGIQESPVLNEALVTDLAALNLNPSTLHYVDDLLSSCPSYVFILQHTAIVLCFLLVMDIGLLLAEFNYFYYRSQV